MLTTKCTDSHLEKQSKDLLESRLTSNSGSSFLSQELVITKAGMINLTEILRSTSSTAEEKIT